MECRMAWNLFLVTFLSLSATTFAYRRKAIFSRNNYVDIDPDIFRNVSELISSKGYPVQEYKVQTADGYILGVERIPQGRRKLKHNAKASKKAVYLQHGLLADSSSFVLDSAEKSLGFVLADAGYDVWLGNVRGNTYSRSHTKYSPKSKEFWEFTFDEMAQYDVPAIIDFILNMTGQSQLYYIGHSQGTTVMFGLLSENPKYNQKIKVGIAMAPVATLGYTTSPIRYIAPFANDIEFLFRVFGYDEFGPSKSLVHYFAEFFCDVEARMLCENIEFLVSGNDMDQFNTTRLPVYFSHTPSGTSTLNIVHFGQLINSRNFQKMDYGKKRNMEKYGQSIPPLYNVENITTPVVLMWGLNDLLADPADVAMLAQKLKNVVVDYQVPFPLWAHLDFAIGIDANKYVYAEILKILAKY